MIVDSSAVVAAIKGEPGWEEIDAKLAGSTACSMSAGTYLEVGMVVDLLGDPTTSRRLDRLLTAWGVEVVPVTREHAVAARQAHREFGRRSGHPARLNFGDCFSYALASLTSEPLLFVGDDFTHTDVLPA